MTTQIRLYLEIAAVVAVLAVVALFVHHERAVGAEKVHTADAKALQAAREKSDAQTKLNQERATKAEENAKSAQNAVDQYIRSHAQPDGKPEPVRMCHANNSQPVPAQGSGPKPSPESAGTGSAAVSKVPGGGEGEGPDIAPELNELVLSAARVAVLYTDLQRRQPVLIHP